MKPIIRINFDSGFYRFAFIPTIVYTPKKHRHHIEGIIDIWWLNIHTRIG